MNKLPNKLSDLLELAIKDLKSCEADPKFVIDMLNWCKETSDGTCGICLAGAVMVRSLGIITNSPNHVKEGYKLLALDSLRSGRIHEACSIMNIQYPKIKYFGVKNYFLDGSEMFYESMKELHQYLISEGL